MNRFARFSIFPATISVCVLSATLQIARADGAGTVLIHSPMDTPFRDDGANRGLAPGWTKNCYGKNSVDCSPGKPFAGNASQKIVCNSYESGAVQFYHPLPAQKGKHYTIAFMARSSGSTGDVKVLVRQGPSPYRQYMSGRFEPGLQWERFTIDGFVLADDKTAGLYFNFRPNGPCTLWIDDLRVSEGAPRRRRLPAATGNVIPNGSFEVAMRGDWRSRGEAPAFDSHNPAHGTRNLLWNFKPAGDGSIVSRVFEFGVGVGEKMEKGETFVLSLSARSTAKADLVATIWPARRLDGTESALRLSCKPTSKWNEFRVEGKLPADPAAAYYAEIRAGAKTDAQVCIDSLRLQPLRTTNYPAGRKKIEVSLSTNKTAHIFRRGEPVTLNLRAFNHSDKSIAAKWTCRVGDYWRKSVGDLPVSLAIEPDSTAESMIELPITKTGVYLAELHECTIPAVGQESESAPAVAAFSLSILPAVSKIPAERSSVGGHFRIDDFHMAAAKAMGVKWTRIHDCEKFTHWRVAEPEQGRFVWHDDKIETARRYGVRILGEFLQTPSWASSAGADVAKKDYHRHPPRNLDEFSAYVRAVVGHYKGYIRHWEVWNEPYHDGFWRGTARQYAHLVDAAARAAHAADPGAKILAPCVYPDLSTADKWITDVFESGGMRDVDIFSYHGYGLFQPNSYLRVQKWAGWNNSDSRGCMPIWNSETGPTSKTFYRNLPDRFVNSYTNWLSPLPYRRAAENSAKLYAMSLAGGADRYFQYWCVYEDSLLPRLSAMSCFEYDSALRPMGVSYAVAASILDGTSGQGWVRMKGSALASLLADKNRMVAVVWRDRARRNYPYYFPISPKNITVRNIMGNPAALIPHGPGFKIELNGEPLYLIADTERAAVLRTALEKAEPLP